MGEDEEGTLSRLKAHRRDLVDPKIAESRGRIVKTTGDGLLVEFGSVVDAVRCAAEIQRGMLDRDPDVPDERRIRFRIGVNLGDIIVDGGDIFGDGSTSRRDWRRWPSPAACASRTPCATRSTTNCPIGSTISASSSSKISPARSAPTRCLPKR